MLGASARAEQSIAGVAESGEDVAVLVELAVECGSKDRHVGVSFAKARDAFRRGDKTEELDPLCTGALERRDRARGASAGREHWIEQEEIALRRVARHLEVVVHRLERVVVAIQADVPNARTRHELQDPFDHAESRAKDRHERQLLARNLLADGGLERRYDLRRSKREVRRGFVRHEHRELVHELLEDLLWCGLIAQQGELVLHQGVREDGQSRDRGGGRHRREGSNFGAMKEYQAVILRLTRRQREDEDALTDLMNERSRGGWTPAHMTQDGLRITVIFARAAARAATRATVRDR